MRDPFKTLISLFLEIIEKITYNLDILSIISNIVIY